MKFDEEEMLTPSQILLELCNNCKINPKEFLSAFEWFSDSSGKRIYVLSKNMRLDYRMLLPLKSAPCEDVLRYLQEYARDRGYKLEVYDYTFLNSTLYFFSVQNPLCLAEPFDKRTYLGRGLEENTNTIYDVMKYKADRF